MTPFIAVLGLLTASGVGFLAGHVWTGWREGIGPFAETGPASPQSLPQMGRALRRVQ